jgi:hypothetical protein
VERVRFIGDSGMEVTGEDSEEMVQAHLGNCSMNTHGFGLLAMAKSFPKTASAPLSASAFSAGRITNYRMEGLHVTWL